MIQTQRHSASTSKRSGRSQDRASLRNHRQSVLPSAGAADCNERFHDLRQPPAPRPAAREERRDGVFLQRRARGGQHLRHGLDLFGQRSRPRTARTRLGWNRCFFTSVDFELLGGRQFPADPSEIWIVGRSQRTSPRCSSAARSALTPPAVRAAPRRERACSLRVCSKHLPPPRGGGPGVGGVTVPRPPSTARDRSIRTRRATAAVEVVVRSPSAPRPGPCSWIPCSFVSERLAAAELFQHVVHAGHRELRMQRLLALAMGVELFAELADAQTSYLVRRRETGTVSKQSRLVVTRIVANAKSSARRASAHVT